MKIALFHHIDTGGAKRAVWEHAKGLRDLGHTLHLFTPTKQTDDAFLPLAPLCEKVFTYESAKQGHAAALPAASARSGNEGRARQTVRRVLGDALYETARDTVWVRKQEQKRAALTQIYTRMARDIASGGYDVLYAHQCGVTLAPPLLRFVQNRLPVVFYCQDTLRRFSEWPAASGSADVAPSAYDTLPSSTLLRRKRWGRVVSPILAAFGEREQERFVHNLRAAPVVLVNSLYSREAMMKATGVPARVNYLGVDARFFCPASPNTATENEVLSLGALRPEKRHDFVIAAVATLPSEARPTVRVVGYGLEGIGRAFADDLQKQADAQGVRLTIAREVTDEIVREAYRRAHVFAFAPCLEPFGLVILEALACGTPVVVTNEGGPREIVQNGVTGFAADATDPVAFGNALARITGDSALRATMAQAGRADALARWTWEQSCHAVEKILLEAAQ